MTEIQQIQRAREIQHGPAPVSQTFYGLTSDAVSCSSYHLLSNSAGLMAPIVV